MRLKQIKSIAPDAYLKATNNKTLKNEIETRI